MNTATTHPGSDLPRAWPFEEAAKVAERLRASERKRALF
jgi:hypothetical protein